MAHCPGTFSGCTRTPLNSQLCSHEAGTLEIHTGAARCVVFRPPMPDLAVASGQNEESSPEKQLHFGSSKGIKKLLSTILPKVGKARATLKTAVGLPSILFHKNYPFITSKVIRINSKQEIFIPNKFGPSYQIH